MWRLVGWCAPLVAFYPARGYERHGPQELSDFKIFGDGSVRLLSDLGNAMGLKADEVGGWGENIPNAHEADILRGSTNEESESFLEIDYDGGDPDAESDEDERHDEFDEAYEDDEELSFLHTQDGAHLDPEDPEDLEDGFETELSDADQDEEEEEDFSSTLDPADPYGSSEDTAFSYTEQNSGDSITETVPSKEENAEEINGFDEYNAATSFVEMGRKTSIRVHNPPNTSSFLQPPRNSDAVPLSDQTPAEDEMIREASPDISPGEGAATSEEPGMLDEKPSGKDFLDESAQQEAGAGGEREAEADYPGPADPMVGSSGTGTEDWAAEEMAGAGGEITAIDAGGPISSRMEEAALELPETEDELAADLQGSFPRIQTAQPHVVQQRHVDQDIKLTEVLRTEGNKANQNDSSYPKPLATLFVACSCLALLWMS